MGRSDARRPFSPLQRAACIGLIAIAAISASWPAVSLKAQVRVPDLGRVKSGDQDNLSGVHLPTDRALTRAMTRVRERLAEREYHQALGFLQEILQRDEDSFVEQAGGEREQQGLKATARRMIGELPKEGLEVYELLHGAIARRQLEAALAAGDQNGVAAVVRQFFHTSAGYEAALVLAQMEADQGHHLAAMQLYEQLIETPRAAARFEPQLSALAAVNYMAAHQPEMAAATLRSLLEKQPDAVIELYGQQVTPPPVTGELSAWLVQRAGQPLPPTHSELRWLTMRGNPGRNAQHPGGRPHLRPRWVARFF
jgi:tetratricopeptide (TPR) repeat protein